MIIIVVLSITILLLMVVAIIIIITISHIRRLNKADHYIPLVVDGNHGNGRQVFIINSPQSDEEDLYLIRKLCYTLADHSIKPVNYEYSSFDRQHGPGHSGIYQWAESNFTECDMILFVCNKSFCDAWSNGDTDHNSLISATKLLLQGYLSNRDADMSLFGIILLRQADDQYVPSLYLKGVQKFVVYRNDECLIEDLLNHMHQCEN